MTPEAKQLLKDKPELCKEIATQFAESRTDFMHNYDPSWDNFLKEHTKPDWEILSFKEEGHGSIARLTGITYYKYDSGVSWSFDDMIKALGRGYVSIHSVRRSDGEVFEVDTVTDKGTIKSFSVSNWSNELAVTMHNDKKYLLSYLTKLKPLFKTEDGVKIYKKDKSWAVNPDTLMVCREPQYYHGNSKVYKYFSTREAAEAWVEDHKPRYSIADLKARGLHI